MEKFTVIDVGHGSCSVLESGGQTVVIDTAGKTHLQQFLASKKIQRIDLIIISHTDADHIRGLINLLSDSQYSIGRLVINPDSSKTSTLWEDARFLIDDLVRRTDLQFETGVSANKHYDWTRISDSLHMEISSPNTAMVLTGPGLALPRDTRVLTSNSVSIVVRVIPTSGHAILVTGDMDRIALDEIIKHSVPLNSKYLIYPHHGGLPGTDDVVQFTNDLLAAVTPETLIFSNGRGAYGTPRPEIIATSRSFNPLMRIACTQLSKKCCETHMARTDYSPINYSAGVAKSIFCAGSVEINLQTGEIEREATIAHETFVAGLPNSLCRS